MQKKNKIIKYIYFKIMLGIMNIFTIYFNWQTFSLWLLMLFLVKLLEVQYCSKVICSALCNKIMCNPYKSLILSVTKSQKSTVASVVKRWKVYGTSANLRRKGYPDKMRERTKFKLLR